MAALVIGAEERLAILQLRLLAEANPFDIAQAEALAARAIDDYRAWMETMSLVLPVGYQVTYSREIQSFGLCDHISVSVARRDMLPSPEAMELILEAFGMQPAGAHVTANIWVESVAVGLRAVNIVQIVADDPR
jgi:hypothetical protein